MKRYLTTLLLVTSLLFNLSFLAGFWQAGAQGAVEETARDVTRRVADELNLTDEQAAVFARLRSGLREDSAVYEQSLALVQQELVDEIRRPEPDLDRLRAIIDRQAELHRDRRLESSQRFGEFLGVLSHNQRMMLSRKLHHDRYRRGPRHRHLKRFDADGDGTLDDEERAAARRFLDQRRAEREKRWRAKVLRRHDADGDGTLDDREQAAADAFFERHRDRRDHWLGARLLKALDRNADRRLGDEELAALHRWVAELPVPETSD